MKMRMTEGLRSSAVQAERFAQGRTKPGPIITRAAPGYSFHEYGLAFDSCFIGPDPYLEKHKDKEYCWKEFGRLAVANGLMWGGNFRSFKDKPHCEKSFGLTISELRDLSATLTLTDLYKYLDTISGG